MASVNRTQHRANSAWRRRYEDPGRILSPIQTLWLTWYLRGVNAALPELGMLSPRRFRWALKEIAVDCLGRAGYRMRLRDDAGAIKTRAAAQADWLMHMPTVQRTLEEACVSAGITPELAAKVLYDGMIGKPVRVTRVTNADGETIVTEVSDPLAALRLKAALTTGFAPSKSAQVTAHVTGSYDPAQFADDPEIVDYRVMGSGTTPGKALEGSRSDDTPPSRTKSRTGG
jgi:hypothetical protein